VQPCKLYISEPGIRGRAGTAVGGGDEKKKKQAVKSEKPQRARKRSVGGWNHLPPPRIRRCPAMSGQLSLCAGVEAPVRAEPSSKAARRRARAREGSEEHVLPFYRGICTCAEHVCIRAVRAMRAARLDKSALASPCTTLYVSAFQVIVVVFSQARKRREWQC